MAVEVLSSYTSGFYKLPDESKEVAADLPKLGQPHTPEERD
jgi:hypothetical protein